MVRYIPIPIDSIEKIEKHGIKIIEFTYYGDDDYYGFGWHDFEFQNDMTNYLRKFIMR